VKIAFLGDSLTEGWPGAAYLPLLVRRLPRHELLNHGRAGDSVADLLPRLRHGGLQKVDLAFVWVGANDAVNGPRDGSQEAGGWSWGERLAHLRADYAELLEWAAARAELLVCVPPLILDGGGSAWEARAAEIGGVMAELAAARRACRVLDLRPAFAAMPRGAGPLTTDSVHLTAAGAEVVAAEFARVIDAWVAKDGESG